MNEVRVHYVGYSSQCNEWKDKSKIEVINSGQGNISLFMLKDKPDTVAIYEPFSLHEELSVKIKKALSCNGTASPNIKV